MAWIFFWLFLLAFIVLSYHRASLSIFTFSFSLLLIFATHFNGFTLGVSVSWIIFLVIFIPLNVTYLRQRFISQPVLNFYRQIMPSMSRTEREAIAAGTVSFEGDLFRGNIDWQKFLAQQAPQLTAEERAFIDGPVEELCRMLDDWDITHHRQDLPPAIWSFLKEQNFFGLIIPKSYGGKQFSAYAHSEIITKVSSVSIAASTTIAVPNSLGPAELLLHYGTEEQKNYYLPRLAKGEEIPCFALTSPDAGSDAGSMTDYGIVTYGEHEGEKKLGIKLNWNKRYITLAPIATVIGLAFKLYDPDNLLGDKKNIGITCALIPRHTAGVQIGRRHITLSSPFQNGPTQGKNVFIPIEWIIGGVSQAGNGWRMLMECLAAGRAISLPSTALGGAKVLCHASGAYARIRKQFNLSICRFEGIEEVLARIAAYTYIMDAARTLAVSCIDLGEKPAIASAIVKYHVTEFGRKLACDGMDLHGGKGICLGRKNYLGRSYQSSPIAITVEGANILTRNLIIFGQGAMRCHPYVLAELKAAKLTNNELALKKFDVALHQHMAYAISNTVRTFILSLTNAYIAAAPQKKTRRYFQQASRFSSALAFLTDICMLCYGSRLKRKESVSARLGDVLSYLYLLSAILKHDHQTNSSEDFPIVRYASDYCLFTIQERLQQLIDNFPYRPVAWLIKILIFPWGYHLKPSKNKLNRAISQALTNPTATRRRLTQGAFLGENASSILMDIEDALNKSIAAEPIEKLLKSAYAEERIFGYTAYEQATSALENNIINKNQFEIFAAAEEARAKVIAVDDFSAEELVR